MSRNLAAALAVFALVLLLAACGRDPGPDTVDGAPSLLRHVPADSPYVFVADRHLPQGLRERLADQYAAQLAAQEAGLARMREQIEAAPGTVPMVREANRLFDILEAFFSEFEGRDTAARVRELGIEPVPRSVLYGLGLLPALRLEIADAAALNALLDRVEARAGVSAMRAEIDGQAYRRIDLGEVDAVIAVSAGHAVAGLLADSLFERDLPLLLGQRMPERDMAESGDIAALVERHGFAGYGEGMVRLDAMVAALLGKSDGRMAETMQALGNRPLPASTGCMALVEDLAGGMPRMVLGVTRADERQLATRGIWESSPAVAGQLRKLAAPVPGVGGPFEGLIAVGLGIDLPALRNGIEALLRRIASSGRDCEWVDPEALQAVLPQLNLALGPMTAGIKGLNIHLNDLDFDPQTLQPRAVRAGLLAAVDDPRGVFALGAMFNPALATLEIPTDGSLVELPAGLTLEPGTPPLRVAIRDRALVLLAGERAGETLRPLLDAAVVSPSPLFAVDYGVFELVERFGDLLDNSAELLAQQGEAGLAEELREQVGAFRLQARLFDRLRVSLYATEQGLVMDQVMLLR